MYWEWTTIIFNHCSRYSVFYDNTCSCENLIKANEEPREKCSKKCRNLEELFCGGDETESFYETGSKLPGSIRNLKIKERTNDRITIEFDPPERNSSFDLTGKKSLIFYNFIYQQSFSK